MPDIPVAIVDDMIDLRTGDIHTSRVIATAKALAELVDVRVVLIIIDTLNRALAGGDENSSADMGRVVEQSAERIKRGGRAPTSQSSTTFLLIAPIACAGTAQCLGPSI